MIEKPNVILLCCSLLFSVYGLESYLYFSKSGLYSPISNNRSMRINAAKNVGVNFDTRTLLEFIQDSQSNGSKHVMRVPPIGNAASDGLKSDDGNIYPLAGISNRTTIYCNVYGNYLLFDADQWGFRNPVSAYQGKPIDVAILGDSFSMGHCEKKDIGSLLRQRGFTATNFAYSGNGPLIELATLREFGSNLKPKAVVWLYYEGNDLSDLKTERKSSILTSYLSEDFTQDLISMQSKVDDLLLNYSKTVQAKKEAELDELYSWTSWFSLAGTTKFIKTNMNRLRPKKKRSNQSQLTLFEKILQQAKYDTEKFGGKLYFVYLPEWKRLAKTRLSVTALHRDDVLNIAKGLDIPVMDLTDDMSSAEDPLKYFPFRLSGHYNSEGYSLLADRISEKLRSN